MVVAVDDGLLAVVVALFVVGEFLLDSEVRGFDRRNDDDPLVL